MMVNSEVVRAIENILANGYDVEIRKNKYGITVASVGKKVVCKTSTDNRESVKESERETIER